MLVQARIADRTKPLSPEKIQAIREAFAEYTESQGVTFKKVARQTGYSDAVISQFVSDSYKGNVDRVAHALNDWMERDARRNAAARPKDYVETQVAEDIKTIVGLADKRCKIAAIVVPSGAGKTYVLQALCEQTRGLYVYCIDGMSRRDLIRAIAAGLGIHSSSPTTAELHAQVVEALRGTKRMIFLDEAHRLGKVVGTVRSIHDQAAVPIIMAGTVDILHTINDRTEGRGQMSRRTIRYNAMDYVRNAEDPKGNAAGRDLFSIDEVKKFFDMKKIRLDRDALKFLWLLACLPGHGSLGLIEDVAETALELHECAGVVKRDHVVTALRMERGADAIYMERLTERHVEITRTAKVA